MGNQAMAHFSGCTLYTGNDFWGWATSVLGSVHWDIGGGVISGPFGKNLWAASIRDLTDGTSNTILHGEVRPMCGDHFHLGGGWAGFNSMWTVTTGPINWNTCPDHPDYDDSIPADPSKAPCHNLRDWGLSQAFKSRHPGGAQFLLGDGSVHFLSENIDYITYQKLGDRRDGQVIGEF